MARRKPRGRPRKSANKGENNTNQQSGNQESVASGVPQSQDARQTRKVDDVQGLPVLEFRSESTVDTPVRHRLIEVRTPAEQPGATNDVGRVCTQQNLGNRATWASLFPVNGLDLSTV